MECGVQLIRQIRSVAIRNLVIPSEASINDKPSTSSSTTSSSTTSTSPSAPSSRPSTPPPPIIPQPPPSLNTCIIDLPTTYLQLLSRPGGERGKEELEVFYTSVAAQATLNPTWLLDLEFKDLPELDKEICFRIMLGVPPPPPPTSLPPPTTNGLPGESASAANDSNPTFRLDDDDDDDDNGDMMRTRKGGDGSMIAEFHVDINHLWCLPSHVKLSNLSHLPSNALILATMEGGEGLLLPDVLYQELVPIVGRSSNNVLSRWLSEAKLLDLAYIEELEEYHPSMLTSFKEEEAQDQANLESAMRSLQIVDKDKKAATEAEIRRQETIKAELKELELSLASQQRLLLEEEEGLKKEEEGLLQVEAKELENLMERNDFLEGEITLARSAMEKEREDLLLKEFLLEARQMKLLGELQSIYPIERLEQEYAIRGLELPADIVNSTRDDEHISSALGYVCHVVFMLSKYLQVPLRYSIEYRSSRSQIRDASIEQAIFPLYRKGVERERFEWAISLLKKDIQQLIFARGLKVNPEAHMLQSLQALLLAESSPKLL